MKMLLCANDADSSPVGLLHAEGSSRTALGFVHCWSYFGENGKRTMMQIQLCDSLLGMTMLLCANDADSSPVGLLQTEESSRTAPVFVHLLALLELFR